MPNSVLKLATNIDKVLDEFERRQMWRLVTSFLYGTIVGAAGTVAVLMAIAEASK